MELTREEAIRLHRELWGWLAENPMKGKTDWPGWDKYEKFDNRNSDCFLCEYAGFDGASSKCENCPVVFVENTHIKGTTPYCLGGLFFQWYHASAPEERSRLAALIRDLPEKKVEKPKRELKIGDWVEVLNTGGCHTTYDTFFTENNLDQFAGKFRSGGNPVIGVAHKIVAIGKYEGKSNDCYGPLYVIEASNGQVYIMNNSHKELELTDPPKIEPKFKEGDKVVPVSKSDGKSWERWKEANNHNCRFLAENGYLYISEQSDIEHLVLGVSPSSGGDFFLESDLIPYVEPPARKFKVGDIICGNAQSDTKYNITTSKMTSGEVIALLNDGCINVKVLEHTILKKHIGKTYSVYEEYFELVTDEPKAEAKTTFIVGDRVRNIKEYDYHPEAVGKIGTVIQVKDSDYTAVEFDEYVDGHNGLGKGKEGYCWCFEPEYLELVKDESKQEPKSFEIGDRVRIKANGRVGTVKGIINSHPSIGVEFNEPITFGHAFNGHLPKGKKGHCYFCYEEEIELLPINHCPENKTIEDTCVGTIDRFPRKFIFNGNKTTCIISLDGKQYKGTAKCAPSDKWDETLGAELAYTRAGIALWKDHERQLLGRG